MQVCSCRSKSVGLPLSEEISYRGLTFKIYLPHVVFGPGAVIQSDQLKSYLLNTVHFKKGLALSLSHMNITNPDTCAPHKHQANRIGIEHD
jgi:hypothetical protein